MAPNRAHVASLIAIALTLVSFASAYSYTPSAGLYIGSSIYCSISGYPYRSYCTGGSAGVSGWACFARSNVACCGCRSSGGSNYVCDGCNSGDICPSVSYGSCETYAAPAGSPVRILQSTPFFWLFRIEDARFFQLNLYSEIFPEFFLTLLLLASPRCSLKPVVLLYSKSLCPLVLEPVRFAKRRVMMHLSPLPQLHSLHFSWSTSSFHSYGLLLDFSRGIDGLCLSSTALRNTNTFLPFLPLPSPQYDSLLRCCRLYHHNAHHSPPSYGYGV